MQSCRITIVEKSATCAKQWSSGRMIGRGNGTDVDKKDSHCLTLAVVGR